MYQGKPPMLDPPGYTPTAGPSDFVAHKEKKEPPLIFKPTKPPVERDCGLTPPFLDVRHPKFVTPPGPNPHVIVLDE